MTDRERDFDVQIVEAELGMAVNQWLSEHAADLSLSECAWIVHRVCSRIVDKMLYRSIKAEREGGEG